MILGHDDETIIAQCTPKGSGAIALLRISGIEAFALATKISKLPSRARIDQLPSHTIHFGYVVDPAGNHIDQVLFLLMRGPKTFTGQDTVEITCHNNPFIIQDIIAQAIAHGARMAQEGEFTKRAVINDKIDLIQAESINELIHANTQMALKKSLAQLEGSFSHWITSVEKELTKALAYSESSFEFLDEEISFGDDIKNMVRNTLNTLAQVKNTFNQQQHIRQGVRVAIIGSVNAGKSSLFNALLNKERAIVTNIAGTTRDVIEAGVYKQNAYWTLIDTAGLRQTDDSIEQEGIKRSKAEAHQADVILLVFDASRTITDEENVVYEELLTHYGHKTIVIHNKVDVGQVENGSLANKQNAVLISTKTKHNIDAVEKRIEEKIGTLFASIESPYLLNQRHYNTILSLEKKLRELLAMMDEQHIAYELVSYHLNDALVHISQLTGKSISEQAMDAIFKEFCVGK
jgi:tRNA modification GTPase